MSQHNEEVKVNFGATAILSFVIVLVLVLFFSTCHGPFNAAEKATTEKAAEK